MYNIGENPHNLVIFLHGYNGNIADHQYAIDWLKDKLQSAYLAIPIAPEICDKNASKRQWFGMLKYDPANLRSNPQTPTAQILEIYNHAHAEIANRAKEINHFITDLQQKYNIDNEHTFLLGFSQGAMLTIYSALTRSQKLAKAFVLSGLVAGITMLERHIKSKPDFYLFHGEEDLKVQFKTLENTQNWLNIHQIPFNATIIPNLAHRICEEEIDAIAKEINENE